MIAVPKKKTKPSTAELWQAKFLELLPLIREQARIAFLHEPSERREEMTAEVVANCWVAFIRLMKRGLDDIVYATPLAQFAIRQTRAGRRVGRQLNVRDITSRHCQINTGARVGRLDQFDEDEQQWQEVLIEDRHAGPAEIAANRIDFADWLTMLSRRSRKIATTLATGETTTAAARQFRVSPARISQIRGELKDCWERFQGEDSVVDKAATATA